MPTEPQWMDEARKRVVDIVTSNGGQHQEATINTILDFAKCSLEQGLTVGIRLCDGGDPKTPCFELIASPKSIAIIAKLKR